MFEKRMLFFVLIFFNTLAYGGTVDITKEELADICEVMEDSILDVTAEYEFLVDPLPEPKPNRLVGTGSEKIKWTGAKPFTELSKFSSKEIFKDISDKERSVHILTSYNGKVAKKFQDDNLPGSNPNGIITNKANFMPILFKTPLIYTAHHFKLIDGVSLGQLLRDKDRLIVELDKEIKKVNGFNTIRADIYRYTGETKVHTRGICFSPEHNFAIVKIELYSGPKSSVSFDVLELEEAKKGIWFPVHGCRSDSSGKGPKNIIKATSKVIINQGLKKEYFDIEFPPGTQVNDEISGIRYVSKPTEEQFDEWLKNEALINEYREKIASGSETKDTPNAIEKAEDTHGTKSSQNTTKILQQVSQDSNAGSNIIIIVFLLVLIALAFFVIRRATKG